MTAERRQDSGQVEERTDMKAALAAKAEVKARLEDAPELLAGLRSIGIGWDTEGARCVRVGLAAEALEDARELLPERVGGVAVELHEAGPIRAHGAPG